MFSSRSKFFLAATFYILSFLVTTSIFTIPLYGYMGYEQRDNNLLLIYTYCITPALLINPSNIRLSRYITILTYTLIYIPSIIITHYSASQFRIHLEPNMMCLALLSAMLIIIFQEYLPRPHIPKLKKTIDYDTLKKYSLIISALLLIAVSSKQYQYFSITNLFDVYDKRQSIQELRLGVFRYLQAWLTNFFLPLAIALGLLTWDKRIILLSILAYISLFFLTGHKSYVFAPAFMLLAYYSIKHSKNYASFVLLIFSGILLLPVALAELVPSALSGYVGMINVRIFSIQGLAVSVYHDFFTTHPQTFFSQMKIFNLLADYPYSSDIPIILNQNYGLGNYNSHFLLSDGFASLGYAGLIIMSVVFSFFIYILDSLTQKEYRLFILATSFYISSLLNVSLATSLLTFGGLLFIALAMVKIKRRPNSRESF